MSVYYTIGDWVEFVLPNGQELAGEVINSGFWHRMQYWVRVRVNGEEMDIPADSIFAVTH